MADLSKPPVIRAMMSSDFNRLTEIDKKILGQARPDYWELKAAQAEKHLPVASLVAEINGKVIGFIIGYSSGWEYGAPERVGWLDTIGIDPDYQRRGVAQMLFKEMIDHLKKTGVEVIYTFASWREWQLLKFFETIGFNTGEMINLKLDI
jgi:ribosomal protein S18 acetylase RimI-like enzyme